MYVCIYKDYDTIGETKILSLLFSLFWTVSPDGLLLQSSTVADTISFDFADGVSASAPCSYIEFAERLLLPEYKNIPDEEVWICQSLFFANFKHNFGDIDG